MVRYKKELNTADVWQSVFVVFFGGIQQQYEQWKRMQNQLHADMAAL